MTSAKVPLDFCKTTSSTGFLRFAQQFPAFSQVFRDFSISARKLSGIAVMTIFQLLKYAPNIHIELVYGKFILMAAIEVRACTLQFATETWKFFPYENGNRPDKDNGQKEVRAGGGCCGNGGRY